MNIKQALIVLLAIFIMAIIATILYNCFLWYIAAMISTMINMFIIFKAVNIMVDYDD